MPTAKTIFRKLCYSLKTCAFKVATLSGVLSVEQGSFPAHRMGNASRRLAAGGRRCFCLSLYYQLPLAQSLLRRHFVPRCAVLLQADGDYLD